MTDQMFAVNRSMIYSISENRSSITNSGLTPEEIDLIWDFYVTKSPAEQSGQSISFISYGWEDTTSKENGFRALEEALAHEAGLDSFVFVRAKTIKDTLNANDLGNDRISIERSRAVLMQNYSISIDEKEKMTLKSSESRVKCLFRHIRNAFAHGNTYFLGQRMIVLEDKEGKTITARILIPLQCLLDWITVVDKDGIRKKCV